MSSPQTKAQVCNQINAYLAKQVDATKLFEDEITDILSKLYDPNISGPHFFYHQDQRGMPIARTITMVDGTEVICTVAKTNKFASKNWANISEPQGFTGKIWPPTRLAHLIGCAQLDEVCVSCDTQYKKCNCRKDDQSEHFWEIWMNKILIRPVENRGFGVIARGPIEAGTALCEFTGEIQPAGEGYSADEDKHHTKIVIGSVANEKATARIESLRTGSFGRFINHSCTSNCRYVEGRCGNTSRIVYVETLRDIATREELTVDYGDE
jgi:hypothetical protein